MCQYCLTLFCDRMVASLYMYPRHIKPVASPKVLRLVLVIAKSETPTTRFRAMSLNYAHISAKELAVVMLVSILSPLVCVDFRVNEV